jgi:hypothetical protein
MCQTWGLLKIWWRSLLLRVIRSQWSWGEALDRAFNRDYDAVRHFFLTGSVKTPVNALTASLVEHECFKSSGEEADIPELESSVG